MLPCRDVISFVTSSLACYRDMRVIFWVVCRSQCPDQTNVPSALMMMFRADADGGVLFAGHFSASTA